MLKNEYIKETAMDIAETLINQRLQGNKDNEIGLMLFDDTTIDELVEELENMGVYVSVYKLARSVEIDERFQTGMIAETEKVINVEDSETSKRKRLIYRNDWNLTSQYVSYSDDVIFFNVPADIGAPYIMIKPDYSVEQQEDEDTNYITNIVDDEIF